MNAKKRPTPLAIGLAIAAAVVGALLGVLTFGVQATVGPHQLPVALGSTQPTPAIDPLLQHVRAEGGSTVSWHPVSSRAEAEKLLDDKAVYAALLFTPTPAGLHAVVLTSGAINPSAQVAQPVLTTIAEAVTSAARGQTASTEPAVETVTMHPASAAGRVLPLAASALLYLTGLVCGLLLTVAGPRLIGRPFGSGARALAAMTAALLGTAAVLGLARLWDSGLPLRWPTVGFLLLVATGFTAFQAGVLRWLGTAGMAILAPLYLMAPSVAGQVPELLNPAYRALLWSWTPFRFSTEGLRSLIYLGHGADVRTALWVFGGLALTGLILLAIPPRGSAAEAEHRHAPATNSVAAQA